MPGLPETPTFICSLVRPLSQHPPAPFLSLDHSLQSAPHDSSKLAPAARLSGCVCPSFSISAGHGLVSCRQRPRLSLEGPPGEPPVPTACTHISGACICADGSGWHSGSDRVGTREPGEGLCIPSLTFCNDHMLGSELLASPPATFFQHISCCHIRPFLSSAP